MSLLINYNRQISYDAYRFVAFFFVVMVHVYPPNLLLQIAYFNVPAMVFISGICSAKPFSGGYWDYVWHRAKRILIPMYIFILPGYLLPLYFAQNVGILHAGLTPENILGCFVFYNPGMGYIWIFKVFLLLTFITPFILKLNDAVKSSSGWLFVVLCTILVQQLLVAVRNNIPMESFAYTFVNTYVLYLLGYAPFLMMGIRMKSHWNCVRSIKIIIPSLILLILGAIAFIISEGLPFDLSSYKYPPTSYYYIYGIGCSLLIWTCKPVINLISKLRVAVFVGQNTNWIYLWHMPIVLLCNTFISNWLIELLIVTTISVIIMVLQSNIVNRSKNEFIKNIFVG